MVLKFDGLNNVTGRLDFSNHKVKAKHFTKSNKDMRQEIIHLIIAIFKIQVTKYINEITNPKDITLYWTDFIIN